MALPIEIILDIQETNKRLLLCGSAALIFAGLLPEREIRDIDFVCNKRDIDDLYGLNNLRLDHYPNNINDKYYSYHAYWHFMGMTSRHSINLLAFDDSIALTPESIMYQGEKLLLQKVDDILYWKEKYNRPKDIKDLNDIVTKAVEDIILK
jgi:hypothetical protein